MRRPSRVWECVFFINNMVYKMSDSVELQLKLIISKGKEQGYLTQAEINDHLPPEIIDDAERFEEFSWILQAVVLKSLNVRLILILCNG